MGKPQHEKPETISHAFHSQIGFKFDGLSWRRYLLMVSFFFQQEKKDQLHYICQYVFIYFLKKIENDRKSKSTRKNPMLLKYESIQK